MIVFKDIWDLRFGVYGLGLRFCSSVGGALKGCLGANGGFAHEL